ncbi:MAG: hypothetical protein IH598_10400 [Bacteroidales bacterium]|nr:hypothetical protein [Bacteroidales bacterium]
MKHIISLITCLLVGLFCVYGQDTEIKKEYTESFDLDSCTFKTTGKNMYFVLEPGFQLTLQGVDGKDSIKLIITVLNETKKIGNIETRIVEENETVNGKTVEISRNYFAFCVQTSSVFYFGEEVDIYKDGKIVSHDGAWVAEGKNKAGIGMPGLILLGSRYYQEIAPGIAMDRAEIISTSEILKTPAGEFINCLKTEETNAIKPKEKEYKIYGQGIGLLKDEELLLVKYGYMK